MPPAKNKLASILEDLQHADTPHTQSNPTKTKRIRKDAATGYQHNARQTKDGRERPAKIISHCTGNSVNRSDGSANKHLLMLEPTAFFAFLLQLNLSATGWYTNQMRTLPAKMLEYDDLTTGAMGIIPPTLLLNLLRDLKASPHKTNTFVWSVIGKKDCERKTGSGKYYMFHWEQNRDTIYRGCVPSWKESVTHLSTPSQRLIDNFGCWVIRKLKPSLHCWADVDIMIKYKFYPGCVITAQPYHQRAHLDMDTWGCIIHIPLCREGMMVLVWPKGSRQTNGRMVHVPFGTYLVLPSFVVHAGVYGNPGNLRFHMVIRPSANPWVTDRLLDEDRFNKEKMEHRPEFKCHLKREVEKTSLFTDEYIGTLESCYGAFFDRSWLPNLSAKKKGGG
jgi:hypothetical protein